MENAAQVELPRWKCHKVVHAFKITEIGSQLLEEGRYVRHLGHAEGYFGPIPVDAVYILKHKPEVGGYYVVYDDGYQSFSPAKAFEEGYTRL